jgi:hypothetical protein
MPVLLQMHWLRRDAASDAGELLRVLLLWFGPVPADSSPAFRSDRRGFLLCGLSVHGQRYRPKLARLVSQSAHEIWSRGGFPRVLLLRACLFQCRLEPSSGSLRSSGWERLAFSMQSDLGGPTAATTGPYYLAMIAPTLVIGSGIVAVGIYGWLVLACIILLGSKLIS